MTDDPFPDHVRAAIEEALFTGQKIHAIKLHREATGSGLGEAKDAIDALDLELRAKSPERFLAKAQSPGCLGAIAGFSAMTILAVWSRAH